MFKIVNIHIPKCGGTSFRKSLSDHCDIKMDYVSFRNIKSPGSITNLVDRIKYDNIHNDNIILDDYIDFNCISGHILPIRYQKLWENNWKFITWLREPSQRLYSLYYRHSRKKNYKNIIGQYIINENPSVEEFCLNDLVKNNYQQFFYNFNYEKYFFIGIVENYNKDLKILSKMLNISLEVENLNFNKNKKEKEYKINESLLLEIKDFHKEDYDLYNKILKISNERS